MALEYKRGTRGRREEGFRPGFCRTNHRQEQDINTSSLAAPDTGHTPRNPGCQNWGFVQTATWYQYHGTWNCCTIPGTYLVPVYGMEWNVVDTTKHLPGIYYISSS